MNQTLVITMLATITLSIAASSLVVAQMPATSAATQTAPTVAARGASLELALAAARVALDTCAAKDQKIAVSVIDSVGVLKLLLASDGAAARGVQSSTNKALTALTFKAATSELGEQVKADSALADKIAANSNYNTRAGGVLLKAGDEIIGAIGVGGARGSENDEACALAGLEKIQAQLK